MKRGHMGTWHMGTWHRATGHMKAGLKGIVWAVVVVVVVGG